ncbi:hypothetical protein [Novosphingobium sp. Gsoil 351]|uniref:hypothetical protein n=1 Tax=Novosphingobium sp. Gsoil 351 TaxID=2675225 RepID=UPI001E2B1634|nr:hypothetical protein [Novosphingobium sp. Gsoil 351]
MKFRVCSSRAPFSNSETAPVERTVLHKLALAYLLVTGVTAPPQTSNLWRMLGHEGDYAQRSCRQSHGGAMLDGMRKRAMAIADGQPQRLIATNGI